MKTNFREVILPHSSYRLQSFGLHSFFHLLMILLLLLFVLVCCSCGTARQTTQLVERVRTDTVYLSTRQYDSVYIQHERIADYRKGEPQTCSSSLQPTADTVFLRDVSIEYRYKLLRDTIFQVHTDSVPYEVTVTEVKEITRPLTWFDHLSRFCFWLVAGAIVLLIIRRYL